LRGTSEETISKSELNDIEIESLLYVLARDNEGGFIRSLLEKFSSNGLRLAKAALNYPDPDTRWQIADFLGTQDNLEAKELLRQFIDDFGHRFGVSRVFDETGIYLPSSYFSLCCF
jgi:hypothetical protein